MSDAIYILILLVQIAQSPIGKCDPVDGPALQFTQAERRAVRQRIRRACKATGAAPIVCAYHDAVTVRESSGRSSVRHRLGKGENGVGPQGLSIVSHADKWPGPADPDFCVPEVSFVVTHEIVHKAVTRYGARNLWDVQAVFAGRFGCVGDGSSGTCTNVQQDKTTSAICGRMQARGFDCYAPIGRRELGQRIAKRDRAAWVLRQRFGGRHD